MIKEIWCMPHSHLDIGYTHPQPLLLELQSDYITQAIELCNQTKDYPRKARFCWTLEASYVLKRWIKTAEPSQLKNLKELIKEGQICVTALPMHTTPNSGLNEMVHMLSDLNDLREILETDITIAINHDVNGQPSTMGQVMLNSGIDFYLTGINIHFGGIPYQRPFSFLWEMADGKRLCTFLGEHYSLFSQFLFIHEGSTKKMHQGICEYANRLEENGYKRDFAFLTATNPPLYDNNSPDLDLPHLIKSYNEEGHEYKLRIVTAKMLRDKILNEQNVNMPVCKGDWTDYWNFGCGSTARETRVGRLAKQTLKKAEVAECFQLDTHASSQYKKAKEDCYENALVFDEHTWGAAQSVTEPYSYETYSQMIHKVKTAYQAADLSGYLLSSQIEGLCKNPHQSKGLSGIIILNSSEEEQEIEVRYPKHFLLKERQLSALRAKGYVPYLESKEEMEECGLIKIKPFSYQMLTFDRLNKLKTSGLSSAGNYSIEDEKLITPYYQVIFNKETKQIKAVFDMNKNKNIINEHNEYSLFEPVREIIDEEHNPAKRSTFFDRDVDLGNKNISQWNTNWRGKRTKASRIISSEIIKSDYKITFFYRLALEGVKHMEQKITFYTYNSRINMHVSFYKEAVRLPESIYFAIPLCMDKDWECSYDTAGEFVKLDEGQLGNVCRDFVTVDTGISIYDKKSCISLSCPDAPLVQAGDFNFGKESRAIKREENPLLLAWTLNNYWDTNFMADQSGQMQFSYDLYSYKEFDPCEVLANGIRSQNPCVIGAMVDAADKEGSILKKDGRTSIMHIYPAKISNAMIIMLKNLTEEDDECVIEMNRYEVKEVKVVNVQEEAVEDVKTEKNKFTIDMKAHEFKLIRVLFE